MLAAVLLLGGRPRRSRTPPSRPSSPSATGWASPRPRCRTSTGGTRRSSAGSGEIRESFGDPGRTPGKPPPAYEGPAFDGRARSGLPDTVPGDTESGRRGSQQAQGAPVPGSTPESPRARAARLQEELDAADAHAWLDAASRLPPELQDKATAVAEKYREELVEQRER